MLDEGVGGAGADVSGGGKPLVEGERDASGVIPGPIVAAAVELVDSDSVPDIEGETVGPWETDGDTHWEVDWACDGEGPWEELAEGLGCEVDVVDEDTDCTGRAWLEQCALKTRA